jgi:hypothetical protein
MITYIPDPIITPKPVMVAATKPSLIMMVADQMDSIEYQPGLF